MHPHERVASGTWVVMDQVVDGGRGSTLQAECGVRRGCDQHRFDVSWISLECLFGRICSLLVPPADVERARLHGRVPRLHDRAELQGCLHMVKRLFPSPEVAADAPAHGVGDIARRALSDRRVGGFQCRVGVTVSHRQCGLDHVAQAGVVAVFDSFDRVRGCPFERSVGLWLPALSGTEPSANAARACPVGDSGWWSAIADQITTA